MTTALAPTTTPIDQLDFEPACEHRHHHDDFYHHTGDAAWYEIIDCEHCHQRTTGLVCDLWRRTAAEYAQLGIKFTCPKCQGSNPHPSLTFTRI